MYGAFTADIKEERPNLSEVQMYRWNDNVIKR